MNAGRTIIEDLFNGGRRRWLTLTLFIAMLAGCADQRSGPGIRFVVPTDFRGLFEIVEKKDGAAVPVEDGEYVYRIPTNGLLVVDKAMGFHVWHKTTAYYSSGQAIPVRLTSDQEQIAEEVALYQLDNSENTFHFYIGPRSQLIEYLRNRPLETDVARFLAGQMRTNTINTNSENQRTNRF